MKWEVPQAGAEMQTAARTRPPGEWGCAPIGRAVQSASTGHKPHSRFYRSRSYSRMSVPEPKSRILIVDDDVSVAESLGLIFEGRGYDVRRAYSAEDAIDLVAEWQPDAAILDVMLPRMSGIELARAMGTAIPTCPVLLVSGHPGVEDM